MLHEGGQLKADVLSPMNELAGGLDQCGFNSSHLFTFRKNLAPYIERSTLSNRASYYSAADRPIYLANGVGAPARLSTLAVTRALRSLRSESSAQHRG